jgi:hypothetical protein
MEGVQSEEEAVRIIKKTQVVVQLCPRCLKNYFTPYGDKIKFVKGVSPAFAALSRRDNKTLICSDCGTQEAFEDMGYEKWTQHKYWEDKA